MSQHLNSDIDLAKCPCCQQQPKTQLHLLTCNANPKRNAALVELTTGGSTYKEHHNFIPVMTDCIEKWLHNPTCSPSTTEVARPNLGPYSTLLPDHMMTTLEAALKEQTEIGWVNLLRGFFTVKWRDLASQNMVNKNAPPRDKASGNRRAGTIIQRIQGYIHQMWKGRNDMLHKSDKDDENKYISLESAEIRHYFHQPHPLSVQDQHYCQGNVLTILQGRPSFRRRWLMRVRRARAALLKDQLRQSRITSYFNRNNFVRAPSEPNRADHSAIRVHYRQKTITLSDNNEYIIFSPAAHQTY